MRTDKWPEPSGETITVTLHREDAQCLVSGPMDYALKQTYEDARPASIMRLRSMLATALKAHNDESRPTGSGSRTAS